MSVISSIREYNKEKGGYSAWKEERNQTEAKKITYLKNNKISSAQREEDIKRAKIVLNAVDVMDEYSQTRSEDMENVSMEGKSLFTQIGMYAGAGLAALSIYLSKNAKSALKSGSIKNIFKSGNLKYFILPVIAFLVPQFLTSILGSIWSVKKETQASRYGRIEAMEGALSSAKQFAVLNDAQEKEVEKKAEEIKITKKEAKKNINAGKSFGGIFSSIKTIFGGNKKYEKKLTEYNEKLKKQDEVINDKILTDEEILEAKKDQDLVQNVIEKIDVASQEYAENTELATSVVKTATVGSSALSGILLNFILSKAKIAPKTSKIISVAAGFILALASSLYATKLQKNASRVGRFKAKQDLLNNPEKLLYVDKDKLNKSNLQIQKEEEPKKNYFKKLKEIIDNDKEYKKYIKENNEKNIQKSKARENITLTPQQEKRAKQLQQNVFKMFNKVDEKSQLFAESIEAAGEVVEDNVAILASIPMAISGLKFAQKLSDSSLKGKKGAGYILSIAAPMILSAVINVFVTKSQIKASKVADMLAIKEMSNYRKFANHEEQTAQTDKNINKTITILTPPWKK